MSEASTIDLSDHIDIVNGKRLSSKAYVADGRIAVNDIIGMLEDGMSSEEIMNYFPALSEDDILACIAYKAQKGE